MTAPRSAVRRLATARLISITGGGAAYAALNFTIYDITDSATWVAFTLLLTFGMMGFLAPPAGMLGDRYDRRIVMIVSDLAGAFCFGMMALGQDPAWLLVWAFLSACAEAPFWSASEAAIPNVAGLEHLSWANGLLGMSRSAGITIGPALGGALLAIWSARWVFAVNAASFVVSALVIATVHANFTGERGQEEEEFKGLRAGFTFLRRDRVLRTMILAWIVFISGMGMSIVADAPLADAFDAGSLGYGMLMTAWGAGGVLGSLYAKRMRLGAEGTWLVVAGVIISACGIAIALSPAFVPIVVLLFVFGVADGTTFVAEQNLRQRRAPDAVRSRVAAAFTGILHVMLALAFVAAAFVVPWIGAQPTYAIGGVTAGLAVLVLLRMRRLLAEDETRAPSAQRPAEEPAAEAAGDLNRHSRVWFDT